MKKLLYLIPVVASLVSCDNISEDNRYIEVEPIQSQRRVLLEEFTGQRCTNCPAAHAIIEKLEEQYGDELIVVSIHAGSFGIAAPAGLMQPEGNTYAEKWKINAYPSGVVDRIDNILSPDAWAAAIRNEMGKESPIELDLTAEIADHKINISTSVSSSVNLSASYQLWITEDDIVGFQIDEGVRLQDYVHNNVFRACVNGTWGQDITMQSNIFYEFPNEIELDAQWNPEHLNVIGFIYDNSGVLQATKCKVTIEESSE